MLSIALVFKIGLAGVFIGTVVSGLIANITKPIIIYRVCFEKSAASYFQESIKYLLVIGAALAVLIPLQNLLMPQVTIAKFALMIVIITVVFNGIFLVVFGRTEEFKYLYGMVKREVETVMIIVEVMGGLGNQMQQYALYRKLESLGKDARLDVSWFLDKERQTKVLASRKLELSWLENLPVKYCTQEEKKAGNS